MEKLVARVSTDQTDAFPWQKLAHRGWQLQIVEKADDEGVYLEITGTLGLSPAVKEETMELLAGFDTSWEKE